MSEAKSKFPGFKKFKVVDEYYLTNMEPGWHILDSFVVNSGMTASSQKYSFTGMSYYESVPTNAQVIKFLIGYTELGKTLYE